MSIPADLIREHKCLGSWSILMAYCGSIAHGMYVPSKDPNSIDDKDVKVICAPPMEYYLGLRQFGSRGTQEIKRNEWDIVAYEARKAISLLAQGNPNMLTLLWAQPNHYIHVSAAGQLLLTHRYVFVGRHVYRSFMGYAISQLNKMTKFAGRPPSELAYIAGIFDGEGHVSIHRNIPPKPTHSPIYMLDVGITNTDADLIQHLLDEYGGHFGRTGIRDGHRQDCYRWRISGPSAVRFLKVLLPHLRIKNRQAEIAIAFQNHVHSNVKHTPLLSDDLAKREEFRQALIKSRRNKSIDVPVPDHPEQLEMYRAAYMGEKRRKLVEKHGYDTKNAAHLIRLLRMGIEFLKDGQLYIMRHDAAELMAIKRGEWELERVKSEADRLFKVAEETYLASTLPVGPDMDRVNSLAVDIVWTAWQEQGLDRSHPVLRPA